VIVRARSLWVLAAAGIVSLSSFASAADVPTGVIVYDLGDKLVVSRIDGSDRRLLARTPRARSGNGPVWSPDGSRVAFARGGALFVVSVTDRRVTRVANLPPSITSIRWSPDGTRIAFGWATEKSCAEPAPSEVGLFVVHVDGFALREVRDVEATQVPRQVARFFDAQEWSPNGKRVLYREERYERGECRGGYRRGSFVRHVAAAGGRPTTLPAGSQARWSPDGSLLALDAAGGCSLSVVGPNGRSRRTLLPDDRDQACFEDGWIAWSKTGHELYVARWDAIVAVRVSDRRRRMLLGDLGLCSHADFACTNSIVALSRDGERLLVEAEGQRDPILVLLSTDGASRQRLPYPRDTPFDVFLY
jgi:hypothetical protein